MNPEQIKDLIDQLLKTGEVLATEGYKLAVRQVYADIAMNSISLTIMLIFIILSIFIARRGWNGHWDDDDTNQAIFFGGTLSAILLSAISVASLREIVGMAINPGWYAIEKLLGLF